MNAPQTNEPCPTLPSQKLVDEWRDAFAESVELEVVMIESTGDALEDSQPLSIGDEWAELERERTRLDKERSELEAERKRFTAAKERIAVDFAKLKAEHLKTVDGLRARLRRTSQRLVAATEWLRSAQRPEEEQPGVTDQTPDDMSAAEPPEAVAEGQGRPAESRRIRAPRRRRRRRF